MATKLTARDLQFFGQLFDVRFDGAQAVQIVLQHRDDDRSTPGKTLSTVQLDDVRLRAFLSSSIFDNRKVLDCRAELEGRFYREIKEPFVLYAKKFQL